MIQTYPCAITSNLRFSSDSLNSMPQRTARLSPGWQFGASWHSSFGDANHYGMNLKKARSSKPAYRKNNSLLTWQAGCEKGHSNHQRLAMMCRVFSELHVLLAYAYPDMKISTSVFCEVF